MELAPAGRQFLWFTLSLVAVGIFLSSTLILLIAAFFFVYLLFEGTSFHHAVSNLATDSVRIENHPAAIETTVGQAFRVDTILTNMSDPKLRIVRFGHNLPPQIEESRAPILEAKSHEGQQIETFLRAKAPGMLEITTSAILLEGHMHLFLHSAEFRDRVIITARPSVDRMISPIETDTLSDLAVDHLRRGTGTDLAGIRPFHMLDDFHSIDWKVTARTGKLMTRESFSERDPTIMLAIDVSSSMGTKVHGSSALERLLHEAGNLLAAIQPTSPVGLVLYDERRVVTNIEPRRGMRSRENILRQILERAKNTSASVFPLYRATRPYTDLAKERTALTRRTGVTNTEGFWERLSLFANIVLPFYENAESKYFRRLRRQGVFKAFEIICTLPEPVLVIVISDGETNLDGLAEGAQNARTLNHRVVVTIVVEPDQDARDEILSHLRDRGVVILRCSPDGLPRAINDGILKSSLDRTVEAKSLR